jgi:serine-type D-Ala-D-Ala carboxypeptidase/endopeptidase (penicillin-binding protein 4)
MKILAIRAILIVLSLVVFFQPSLAADLRELTRLIGKNDACYLGTLDGESIVSINSDHPLIPASTLKILTSLAAYHYLGDTYRFTTDVFVDAKNNVIIKGYGDPFLTSEILSDLAATAARCLSSRSKSYHYLLLDASYFSEPLNIPGVSDSFEPYDAPNGALCANFNTVSFIRTANGEYAGAEPQTPMMPSVIPRIRSSGLNKGRIILANRNRDVVLYAGELLAYFFKGSGLSFTETIDTGIVNLSQDERVLSYVSAFSLDEIVANLLAYSNNFIANQLFISIGAKVFGPPGTIEKGVRAVEFFAQNSLGLPGIQLVEGSGISRENRISARDMTKLLAAFLPHREQMRQTDKEYYKTGTLTGISTRAGYLKGLNGTLFPFVVMINSPGLSANRITEMLYSFCTLRSSSHSARFIP